jgi:hypothetical protein
LPLIWNRQFKPFDKKKEMRQPEEFFQGQDLRLIYISKKLKKAEELEDILEAAELDYFVEPDEYVGGLIFRQKLIGAFFYVSIMSVPQAHAAMKAKGYVPYEPQED